MFFGICWVSNIIILQPDSDPLEATFELNDTLYAKALISYTKEVYLWLGANVMLAYPIPEAEELLESKLEVAKKNLANCEEDLDFLREQVTVCDMISESSEITNGDKTLEVATARVYNWDVTQKRKEKADQGDNTEDDKTIAPNG